MTIPTNSDLAQKVAELMDELTEARSTIARVELERDELESELDEVRGIDDLLQQAVDMAHAQHDHWAPRRLCRQEMCLMFNEAGVADR